MEGQLYLIEVPVDGRSPAELDAVFDRIASTAGTASGDLIEVQVGSDLGVAYAIVEHRSAEVLDGLLRHAGVEFKEIAPVRLVGQTLDEVKATRGAARYLVEWDIPKGTTMDQYLTRKRTNAPRYALVPETKFLRTYVREDLLKCVCIYDAPDEDAVRRAREAVDTPVDRLTRLGEA